MRLAAASSSTHAEEAFDEQARSQPDSHVLVLVAAALAAGPAVAQQKVIKFIPEADLRSIDPIWTTALNAALRGPGYERMLRRPPA